MGWIIFTIAIFVVVTPIIFVIGTVIRSIGRTDKSEYEGIGSFVRWVVPAVPIVIWIIFTLASMFHQVPNGHVGAIYTFKAVTGTTGSGLVVTAPWQEVKSLDVREQSFGWVAQEHREGSDFSGVQFRAGRMETFSDDNQDVYMDVTINIKVDREAVENILDNVGPDYFGKLFVTELPNVLKEETTAYDSTVIAQFREELRNSVRTRMQEVLDEAGYAITVTKIGIYNMSFDPEYAKAIQDKVIAEQNAITEFNKIQGFVNIAEQQRAEALGKADVQRTLANGTADANRAIHASLSPQLLTWQAIAELGPNVKIALIPSGQDMIIDPSNIFGTGGGFSTAPLGPPNQAPLPEPSPTPAEDPAE